MRIKLKGVICMALCMLLISGCRLQDINDVYSMVDMENSKSSSSLADTEPEWYDGYIYKKLPGGKELPTIREPEEQLSIKRSNRELLVSVEEAYVTDNYNDIYNYTDEQAGTELYDDLMNVHTGYINKDGTTCIDSKTGVKFNIVIIKYNIYNPGNEEDVFLPTIPMYDIRYDSEGNVEYYKIPDPPTFVDKPDGWGDHVFSHVTVKAKESREVVSIRFVDEQRVVRYKSHRENGKNIIDEVETDGKLLNNVYLGSGENSVGNGPDIYTNKELIKLKLTYKE